MKKLFCSICLFFFAITLYSEENPYSQLKIEFKNPIQMRTGGEIDFEVKLNLPNKHFIYLNHANQNGIGIITSFSIPEETGFQLMEISRPKGIKKEDEFVLKKEGTFKFKFFELGTKRKGSNVKVTLKIRTQLCEDTKNGICYPPKNLEQELLIEIKEDKKSISFRNLETISWEPNFDSAIKKAKAANVNIYALISEPSWCGACRYMEKEAFDKPDVQKILKNKFVAWKVKDNEYGKVPTGSGSFGIPMFFVLDSEGKSLGKWAGARDAKGLLALLKPFEKNSIVADPLDPSPIINENITELEIIASDGSKCILTYGKDYPWIAQRESEFYNNGTFRFGINESEIKVRQFTRDLAGRKTYPITITKSGFRIEKKELKEFWVAECKNSTLEGIIEGTEIRFKIDK